MIGEGVSYETNGSVREKPESIHYKHRQAYPGGAKAVSILWSRASLLVWCIVLECEWEWRGDASPYSKIGIACGDSVWEPHGTISTAHTTTTKSKVKVLKTGNAGRRWVQLSVWVPHGR